MSLQPHTPPTEPEPLTVAEVAKNIGRPEEFVYRELRRKRLVGTKKEDGRTWEITQTALDDWKRANPPDSLWGRVKATAIWQRVAVIVTALGGLLFVVNTVTGFFSNIVESTDMLEN